MVALQKWQNYSVKSAAPNTFDWYDYLNTSYAKPVLTVVIMFRSEKKVATNYTFYKKTES